jgi:DNA-binding NarL/FixJ family response regulator
MIKVAIADDHSLVRQGLRRYLEMADGIEVVGEASDGRELLTLIEETDPDIALVDIRMPEMDGLEAAREIRDRFPKVGVIMLTAYDDRQFVVEAARSGTRYVLKARDAEHRSRRFARSPGEQHRSSCGAPGELQREGNATAAPTSRLARSRSSSCSRSAIRTAISPSVSTSRPTR